MIKTRQDTGFVTRTSAMYSPTTTHNKERITTTVTTSTEDSPVSDAPGDGAPAFAVLHPNGTLEWKPLSADTEVRKLIGGKYGESSVASAAWLGPAGETAPDTSLRILASDVTGVFPEEFALNDHARRVIVELSDDYVIQHWNGVVVLCEFDKDAHSGEVGFPQAMSAERITQINTLHGS